MSCEISELCEIRGGLRVPGGLISLISLISHFGKMKMGWLIDLAKAAGPEPMPAADPTPIAAPPKPRAPVKLDVVLAAACGACDTSAGITPMQLGALLSPEDVADIQAGDIPVETLHAYALSFAEGIRSGRIVVPGGEP